MGRSVQIDDDVMQAAEKIAAERGISPGEVVSDLARRGLRRSIDIDQLEIVDGFPILPSTGKVITPEFVQRLMEEEGI